MADNPQALHKKAVRIQEKMEQDQVRLVVDRPDALEDTAPRAVGVADEQFPTASLGAKDKRDEEMVAKLTLQDPSAPGYTPFGRLTAKDSDFEWYQKKVAAAEAANFQAWFAQNYDLMSPAQKKRAKELFPEFYAQRKKLLKKQAKNLVRLATLKLEGAQTFDDLQLQYMAETGRLDVGPLQNLLNPENSGIDLTTGQQKATQQDKFRRGLLNPFRIFGEEAMPVGTYSATQMRKEETQMFAARDAASLKFGTNLGYTQGFPPIGKAVAGYPESQQQVDDKAWWKQLKM